MTKSQALNHSAIASAVCGIYGRWAWVQYDGDLILTTGAGGNVNLWDGHTAEPLGTVTPSGKPGFANFLPDSETIIVMSFDGEVYSWVRAPTLGGVRLQRRRPQSHDE